MRSRTTTLPFIADGESAAPAFTPESSQNPPPPRLLLTADEAAFALTISTRTLWTLTNAGQIPCVRLGRCVRYAPEALQDWIQGQRK